MLDGACRIAVELVHDILPVHVLPFQPNAHRTLDGREHPLQRETALVIALDIVSLDRHRRIDDRNRLFVRSWNEDEDALEDADLRRRQPHTAGVVHQGGHPIHETLQILVERLHGLCLHPQSWIGVLPDLRKGHPPPRVALGVELLLQDLTLDLGHDGHTSGVERREREAIMRQGVTSPETPQERAQREGLEADLVENPLAGKPLRRRYRNFRTAPDAALRALGGPLAWMRRLSAIEKATERHEKRLAEAWAELRAAHPDDTEFARAWRELAAGWNFEKVNDLIDRHNRHYPTEARLAMNPRTGDYVKVNGRHYSLEPLDERWILAKFPV